MNNKNNIGYQQILSKFVSICNKNKLWYSLANNSLLSSKTKLNYFENIGILEIFVTQKTYKFLKLNYKKNIMDTIFSDEFYLSTPIFYAKNIDKFIKIMIIVPTNIDKVKKFYNLNNKIKYNYSNFLTFKNGYNFSQKILFLMLNIFSVFCFPIEHKEWYDSLYVEDFRGFLSINSLNEKPNKNWFPNLTFKTENVLFLGIETCIIQEYNNFLIIRYGEKWKKGIKVKYNYFDYYKLIL